MEDLTKETALEYAFYKTCKAKNLKELKLDLKSQLAAYHNNKMLEIEEKIHD